LENTYQGENETFAAMTGFFNWTMTYRLDSDIVHPYGWFEPINTSSSLPRFQSALEESKQHF